LKNQALIFLAHYFENFRAQINFDFKLAHIGFSSAIPSNLVRQINCSNFHQNQKNHLFSAAIAECQNQSPISHSKILVDSQAQGFHHSLGKNSKISTG
jgi:hypothetical protein